MGELSPFSLWWLETHCAKVLAFSSSLPTTSASRLTPAAFCMKNPICDPSADARKLP